MVELFNKLLAIAASKATDATPGHCAIQSIIEHTNPLEGTLYEVELICFADEVVGQWENATWKEVVEVNQKEIDAHEYI